MRLLQHAVVTARQVDGVDDTLHAPWPAEQRIVEQLDHRLVARVTVASRRPQQQHVAVIRFDIAMLGLRDGVALCCRQAPQRGGRGQPLVLRTPQAPHLQPEAESADSRADLQRQQLADPAQEADDWRQRVGRRQPGPQFGTEAAQLLDGVAPEAGAGRDLGRIDQRQQADPLARALQLHRHLEGEHATGTQAAEPVRTLGLQRTNPSDVVRRHVGDPGGHRGRGVGRRRLQRMHRNAGAEVLRQAAVEQRLAQPVVDEEHRQARSAGAERDERVSGQVGAIDQLRHLRHRGRLQHGAQRQTAPKRRLEQRAEPHDQQRMPAEVEEVVVHTEGLDLQQVAPEGVDRLLDRVARGLHRPVGHPAGRCRWRRQGVLVELAVGVHRQAVQHHDVRGHHVLGQGRAQPFAQVVRPVGLLCRGEFARHHVGHQALVAGHVLANRHHRLPNAGVVADHRLDLGRLDAEAAQLDLAVDAPEVFQLTVGEPARQVAGAVQARIGLRAERVGDEALGRECGPVQVARRERGARHVDLSGHAHRHRLPMRVEQEDLQVGQRAADEAAGDCAGARARAGPCVPGQIGARHHAVRHEQGGLGRAVLVDDARHLIAVPIEPRLQVVHVERLAAEDHLAQGKGTRRAGRIGIDPLPERRRRLAQHADPLRAHEFAQRRRVAADVQRHHHQPPAVQQRTPDLPDGEVEGARMEERPHVVRAGAVRAVTGREQPQHVVVGHAHALGLAGGAGGVHHIRQIAHRAVATGGFVIDAHGGARRSGLVHADRGQVQALQVAQQLALGHDHARLGILHHEGDAVAWYHRVERQVRRARLEDAQQADDQLGAALRAQRHPVIAHDPLPAQRTRHAGGTFVELGVGHVDALTVGRERRQRHRHRHAPGVRLEALVQRRVARLHRPHVFTSEQDRAFGVGQQGQACHRLVLVGTHAGQQGLQVPDHALDAGALVEVGVVDEPAVQAVDAFGELERQVEAGHRTRQRDVLDPHRAQRPRLGPGVLEHDHGLHQRSAAAFARQFEGLDDFLERQVLVLVGVQHRGFGLGDQTGHGEPGIEVGAQGNRVGEQAHDAFELLPVAPRDDRAGHHRALAAVAVQQRLPERQHHHEEAGAGACAQVAQRLPCARRDGQGHLGTQKARRPRAAVVGRQRQRRRDAGKLPRPVGQLALP